MDHVMTAMSAMSAMNEEEEEDRLIAIDPTY